MSTNYKKIKVNFFVLFVALAKIKLKFFVLFVVLARTATILPIIMEINV
jgi:hypothetical protein